MPPDLLSFSLWAAVILLSAVLHSLFSWRLCRRLAQAGNLETGRLPVCKKSYTQFSGKYVVKVGCEIDGLNREVKALGIFDTCPGALVKR